MPMYMPERILLAPSGFKESLSAVDVADAIAAGVRRVYPGVRIDRQPIPDGGEGTIEILSTRPDAIPHHKKVQGPIEGQSVAATWLELANKTAVVEMASAAGLSLVPSDMRDPGMTSTVGVGELIADALDKGMRTIIIGCGDSGTTDGGAGALTALGVRILDENGADIGLGGNSLHNAASIDTTNLHPRIHQARLHLACNMHNVLTGDHGVAAVFGPQKGATPEQVDSLGRALTHWADLLVQTFNPDTNIHTGPGSGASGGLGAGLMALGAEAHNRFDVFLGSMLNGHAETLDDLFEEADLVITAEGAIDYQTPHGKVPAEIARRAQATGVPVLALAGSLGEGAPQVHDIGIGAVASIMTVPMPLEHAVRDGRELLSDAAERTMRLLQLGSVMSGRCENKLRRRFGAA